MSMDRHPGRGMWARIGDLGPIWITAIAGLIVALAGAGFFASRAATPDKRVAAQPGVTTAPELSDPAPTNDSPPAVYFQGLIKVGADGVDFDLNPPSHGSAGNVNIRMQGAEEILQASHGVLLAPAPSPRGHDACATALQQNGSSWVYAAEVGTVCVKTADGRIGYLQQTQSSPDPLFAEFDALVWG